VFTDNLKNRVVAAGAGASRAATDPLAGLVPAELWSVDTFDHIRQLLADYWTPFRRYCPGPLAGVVASLADRVSWRSPRHAPPHRSSSTARSAPRVASCRAGRCPTERPPRI